MKKCVISIFIIMVILVSISNTSIAGLAPQLLKEQGEDATAANRLKEELGNKEAAFVFTSPKGETTGIMKKNVTSSENIFDIVKLNQFKMENTIKYKCEFYLEWDGMFPRESEIGRVTIPESKFEYGSEIFYAIDEDEDGNLLSGGNEGIYYRANVTAIVDTEKFWDASNKKVLEYVNTEKLSITAPNLNFSWIVGDEDEYKWTCNIPVKPSETDKNILYLAHYHEMYTIEQAKGFSYKDALYYLASCSKNSASDKQKAYLNFLSTKYPTAEKMKEFIKKCKEAKDGITDKNMKTACDTVITKILESLLAGIKEGKTGEELVKKAEEASKEASKDIKNVAISLEKLKDAITATVNGGTPRETYTTFTDALENPENYITSVSAGISEENKDAEKMIGTIVKVISNIGIVISVLVPAVLGVKYMLGSIEEKAEYKKDLIPYVIGAFVLFGISLIIKIVQALGKSLL